MDLAWKISASFPVAAGYMLVQVHCFGSQKYFLRWNINKQIYKYI